MKKILSTLCALAMLFTMAFTVSAEIPAQDAKMTVTIEEGVNIADMQVGDTFNVAVSYSDVAGLAKTNTNNQTALTGLQFKMALPEGFTIEVADGTYPEEIIYGDGNPFECEYISFVDGVLAFAHAPASKGTYVVESESLLLEFPVTVTAVPTEDVTFTITSDAKLVFIELAAGKKTDELAITDGNGLTVTGTTLEAPEEDFTPAVALEGGSEVANTFWYEAAYEAKGQAIESTTIEVAGAEKTKTFTVTFDNSEDLEGTIKFLMGVKNAPAGEYVGTASIVTAAGTAASEAVAVTVE